MKAQAIVYSGIVAVLIIAAVSIIYVTATGEVKRGIISSEGRLITFANEAELLLKGFDQSIEFISSRSAYELGKNGGFYNYPQVTWNYYYPKLSFLEKMLEDKISDELPVSETMEERTINWGEGEIDIIPCDPLDNSRCFNVEGNKEFSIYDRILASIISENHKIDSEVASSYFKLLYVGREILENIKYNSTLNDVNNLKNLLEADFPDLDFYMIVDGDIIDITIEDICYPPETYCLAPLNPGETGITDPFTSKEILYDYIKLNFKINESQTGFTPLISDFEIILNPSSASIKSGEELSALVRVNSLGGDPKTVSLAYTINPPEPTINVQFIPDSGEPTYFSVMKVTTDVNTLANTYTITVMGTDTDGLSKNKDFILGISPSMFFHLEANPPTGIVLPGDPIPTTIDVILEGGTPLPVSLFAPQGAINAITGDPETSISISFSTTLCTPDCSPTMTITTQDTDTPTPDGDYEIEVVGIGGGSMETVTYVLTVSPVFKFTLDVNPDDDIVIPGDSTTPTVSVTKDPAALLSKPVTLSAIATDTDSGDEEPSISTSFNPNNQDPDYSSTMTITTQDTTPDGDYAVSITGTGGGWSAGTTFTLTVKTPDCYTDADCDDGNPCTGGDEATGIDKCIDGGTVDAWCNQTNFDYGYEPDDRCGIETETCEDKCDSKEVKMNGFWVTKYYEYKDGSTETCNILCDGGGNCLPDCTPVTCTYSEEYECRFECEDTTRCEYGYFCGSNECTGGVDYYGCDPDHWCFVEGQCIDEDQKNAGYLPYCQYTDCVSAFVGPNCCDVVFRNPVVKNCYSSGCDDDPTDTCTYS
jgi:hypothetical protein